MNIFIMENYVKIRFEELCPYIRKAGRQTSSSPRNKYRIIFDHELYYCCHGKANIMIKGHKYDIVPGSLVLVKPDTKYSFWIDKNCSAEVYWVNFDFVYNKNLTNFNSSGIGKKDGSWFTNVYDNDFVIQNIEFENGFVFPEYLNVNNPSDMETCFERICFYFTNRVPIWQFECKILLLDILKKVISQVLNNGNSRLHNVNSSMKKVIEYIYNNYSRKITLSELSRVADYSADHLGELFKKKTGMTIIDFIKTLRISHAKKLLARTDYSIENIADIVGYRNMYYFSHVMKKHTGYSPTAWRKKR